MLYNYRFTNEQELRSHAMIKLREFIDELLELLEIDIYNRINPILFFYN